MKHFKTAVSVIAFALMLAPFVSFSAQEKQKGIHEQGAGIENSELREESQGTGQGIKAQDETAANDQGVQNKTMLQNQGEEQKNTVQSQNGSQDGQRIMESAMDGSENGQGNQNQGQAKGNGQSQPSDKAVQRRSAVANAVQEMLQVAERNPGVGQQIRAIAQTQTQNQEQIEAEMNHVKNRGRLKKFFFGPDYKNLNSIEDRLANHEEKLGQLKQLADQITNQADAEKLQEQIQVMEQVKAELEKETAEESKGFSLFGWLNKMLSK